MTKRGFDLVQLGKRPVQVVGGKGSQPRRLGVLGHQIMHGLRINLLSNQHPHLMQGKEDIPSGGEVRANPPRLNDLSCSEGIGKMLAGDVADMVGILAVLNVVKGESATSNTQSYKRLNICTG